MAWCYITSFKAWYAVPGANLIKLYSQASKELVKSLLLSNSPFESFQHNSTTACFKGAC